MCDIKMLFYLYFVAVQSDRNSNSKGNYIPETALIMYTFRIEGMTLLCSLKTSRSFFFIQSSANKYIVISRKRQRDNYNK